MQCKIGMESQLIALTLLLLPLPWLGRRFDAHSKRKVVLYVFVHCTFFSALKSVKAL